MIGGGTEPAVDIHFSIVRPVHCLRFIQGNTCVNNRNFWSCCRICMSCTGTWYRT